MGSDFGAASSAFQAFMQEASTALKCTLPQCTKVYSLKPHDKTAKTDEITLVLEGVKRALSIYPVVPGDRVGDTSILIDSHGNPRVLIRALEVSTVDFDAVDAKFAFDEAIGDLSLETWRAQKSKAWPEIKQINSINGTSNDSGSDHKIFGERFEVLYPVPKSITTDSPSVKAYLSYVSRQLNISLPPVAKDVFDFGDGHTNVTRNLNAAAVAGLKTGTMSFPAPRPPHWGVGDYSVGLGVHGEPYLLMHTLALWEKKFDEVEEYFALSEGEGDYEEWRQGHIHFWREKEDHDGSLFGDGVGKVVLCETFETLWPRKLE
jgi:uncharacterized protein YhfF